MEEITERRHTHTDPTAVRLDFDALAPRFAAAMSRLDAVAGVGLDPKLRELVRAHASTINGCAYCIDMHTKDARAVGETEQRLYSLGAWRETSWFSPAERAALALTEAVTVMHDDHVPAAVMEEAARALRARGAGPAHRAARDDQRVEPDRRHDPVLGTRELRAGGLIGSDGPPARRVSGDTPPPWKIVEPGYCAARRSRDTTLHVEGLRSGRQRGPGNSYFPGPHLISSAEPASASAPSPGNGPATLGVRRHHRYGTALEVHLTGGGRAVTRVRSSGDEPPGAARLPIRGPDQVSWAPAPAAGRW